MAHDKTDAERLMEALIADTVHQAVHDGLERWADANPHLTEQNRLVFDGIAMFVACYLRTHVVDGGDVHRLARGFSAQVDAWLAAKWAPPPAGMDAWP